MHSTRKKAATGGKVTAQINRTNKSYHFKTCKSIPIRLRLSEQEIQ